MEVIVFKEMNEPSNVRLPSKCTISANMAANCAKEATKDQNSKAQSRKIFCAAMVYSG
jgi:hypothetical protein